MCLISRLINKITNLKHLRDKDPAIKNKTQKRAKNNKKEIELKLKLRKEQQVMKKIKTQMSKKL